MVGEFLLKDTYKSTKIGILCSLILITFAFVSCKSIEVKTKPDLLPYILKPIAFLTIKSPKNLESVWPDLMQQAEKYLRRMPTLGNVTGINQINKKIEANPKLRSSYKTYMSTLTLAGISDREIALELEDEFESSHFLLLEFLSFPCTKECPSDEQWIIRLKMIDLKTGEIIYRVRLTHQLDKFEQNSELYSELAKNMIFQVIAEFQKGFIVPWHRWRYEHLKKVHVINLRTEMGI